MSGFAHCLVIKELKVQWFFIALHPLGWVLKKKKQKKVSGELEPLLLEEYKMV